MAVASPDPAVRDTSRALDDAIDSALAGRPTYPPGTTFVPTDIAPARLKRPYVTVAPDGREELHGRRYWGHVALAGGCIALAWALWHEATS